MRAFAALVGALLLASGNAAHACSVPSFAITSGEQTAFGDMHLYRIRTTSALVLSDANADEKWDLLALEALKIEPSQMGEAPSVIRIIMPDRWRACGQLFGSDTLNEAGQIEGYVLLRRDPETGFYVTRDRSSRNRMRLARSTSRLEWKEVTFR